MAFNGNSVGGCVAGLNPTNPNSSVVLTGGGAGPGGIVVGAGGNHSVPTVVLLTNPHQQQAVPIQVPLSPNQNNNNNNNNSSNMDGPHNNKRLCTRNSSSDNNEINVGVGHINNNNNSINNPNNNCMTSATANSISVLTTGGCNTNNNQMMVGNNNPNSATSMNKTLVGGSPSDEPRRKRHELTRPNHILLFTIINPVFPITVEVLHTICNPYGQVQRIVIFKKNGVQAMVEFDSIESATRARDNLNGADIYSGCCTLKIDFAKPEKLNVYKNDSDTSWDFTLTGMHHGDFNMKEVGNGRSPLLQDPLYGSRPQPYTKTLVEPVNRPAKPPLLGPGSSFPFVTPEFHQSSENWKAPAAHPGIIKETPIGPTTRNPAVPFVPQGQQQGAVMMVYGLDGQTSNTEKLFNLVCLYGNVARIKFLKTKEGTAMVQMGDSVAVERCVQHLNNIPVGTNGKLQIAFSKQNFLSEVTNPFSLPDHTPSFKEFTGSKNNRFLSPAQASKNRIQPPSKILHFFNTPPGLTEEQLIGIFNIKEVPPTAVRMFPLKTERSSSGLIEFPSVAQAVLAIMKCNHIPIESKGTKFPFIMKLCFSSSKSMNGTWSAENNGDKVNGDN